MTTDKKARKEMPMARGLLDYFPDACAAVANVSYVGNQQHNPGQELHWSRGKSDDHADCIVRHVVERGTIDDDGLRHSAKAAWRALAQLQIELEEAEKQKRTITYTRETIPDNSPLGILIKLGCPLKVAQQVAGGMTLSDTGPKLPVGWVYIAGPMRGFEKFNFPAFDAARDSFVKRGFNVISPADVDRSAHAHADDPSKVDTTDQTVYAFRDFWANYFIAKNNPTGQNGIVLLPGWTKSTGAAGEFFLDRWLGLKMYYPDGREAKAANLVHDFALDHANLKV